MYIFWYLYFSIVGLTFYYGSKITLTFVILFGFIVVIAVDMFKKVKIKNLKISIDYLLKDNSYNFNSFVNINKDSWEYFNELPGFSSVEAKRAVWLRKHSGKYKSIADFFEKNNVKEENKELLMKIIKIK